MPALESVVLITLPATLNPSISTAAPDETKVKGALEGADIVAPTIERSPKETDVKDSVPEPSVCKTCPELPSDVGSVIPLNVNDPSTATLSLKLIEVESAELILVPRIVTPLATTPPVPPGDKVISAFDGEEIVEPTKEKSPTDTVPNDNVPDPSVCKT